MPTKLMNEALYNDRFKARFGNDQEFGTKPTTPEGPGDVWFEHSTGVLSLSNEAGNAWVDYDLSAIGSSGGNPIIFTGYLASNHDCTSSSAVIDWVEIIDANNLHDDSTNPDRIYFTGQGAGWYEAELTVALSHNTNKGEAFTIPMTLNGTTTVAIQVFYIRTETTEKDYKVLKYLFEITNPESDYISLSTTSGSLTVANTCELVAMNFSAKETIFKITKL